MPREPDDSGMDQFVAEARAFLDANAGRHARTNDEVVWGEGEERITYVSTDPRRSR